MRGMDLFSGPGGLTLGFKRAGIEPLCAVEINKDAIDTYSAHTPEATHFCDDIRNVDLSRFDGEIEIVYGGPPCQPFSTGGLRKAASDQRDMIPAFLDAICFLQPDVVLMENVPGLAVKSRVAYFHNVLSAIEAEEYFVAWRILNAAEYGVPQKRRRLFVVAMKAKRFRFPRPTHGPACVSDFVPARSVIGRTPLGDPPPCPVKYAKYPDLRPSPYAGHVYNGGGRPINLDEPCHTILASAGGYKTHWVDTEGIAPLYHAHLKSGGAPWEGHVPGARRLTVEESALIQTFPAGLGFAGSRSSQFTQVGDAMPPDLAAILGAEIVGQHSGTISPTDDSHLPDNLSLPLFSV